MNEYPTLEELLAKVKALPDDKFPEWIFQISFREFADSPEYWSDYDRSDPRVIELETLAKIKDIRKYLYYRNLYRSYIEDIADRYNVDPSLVVPMFQAGLIKEYIPDIPKPSKKAKEIKRYFKNGELPMERSTNARANMVAMIREKYLSDIPADAEPDPYAAIIRPPTKDEEELLNKGSNEIAAERRMANFKSGNTLGERRLEFVGDYFHSFSEKMYDERPALMDEGGINLDEMLRQMHEEEITPRYIQEHDALAESSVGATWNGNRFVTAKEQAKKEFTKALMEAGFNPLLLYKEGLMKKEEVLLYELGDSSVDDIDGVPAKWIRKKKKKEKKLAKKHQKNLGSMSSLLTSNGFNLGYDNMDPISNEDMFKL